MDTDQAVAESKAAGSNAAASNAAAIQAGGSCPHACWGCTGRPPPGGPKTGHACSCCMHTLQLNAAPTSYCTSTLLPSLVGVTCGAVGRAAWQRRRTVEQQAQQHMGRNSCWDLRLEGHSVLTASTSSASRAGC